MKDKTRIAANTLLSYANQGITAVVGILLVPFMLNRLGEEAYGVIGVFSTIMALMSLFDHGLRTATARQFTKFFFNDQLRRSNEVTSSVMAVHMTMALLLLAVAWIGHQPLLEFFRVNPSLWSDAGGALLLIALTVSITSVSMPYQAALISQLRYDIEHLTKIVNVLLRSGIIVACFVFLNPSLYLWAVAWLTASITAFLIQRQAAYRYCTTLEVKGRLVTRQGFRDIADFGFYTLIAQVSNWLERVSGPLVIGYFLGTAAVAHFTPAIILVSAIQSLSSALTVQIYPLVTRAHARSDAALIRSILIRSTRYSLLLSGGAAVTVGTLAFLLIPLWLGEGFRDTAIVLTIWCAISIFRSGIASALPIFLGTGRLRFITSINVLLAIISVAISIYLVGQTGLGIVGVAYAVLITAVIRTAVYTVTAIRITGVDLSLYIRESYLGPLACLTLTAATALGSQLIFETDGWLAVALIAALTLLVYGILLWTAGLNARDREQARDYLHKGLNWIGDTVLGRSR